VSPLLKSILDRTDEYKGDSDLSLKVSERQHYGDLVSRLKCDLCEILNILGKTNLCHPENPPASSLSCIDLATYYSLVAFFKNMAENYRFDTFYQEVLSKIYEKALTFRTNGIENGSEGQPKESFQYPVNNSMCNNSECPSSSTVRSNITLDGLDEVDQENQNIIDNIASVHIPNTDGNESFLKGKNGNKVQIGRQHSHNDDTIKGLSSYWIKAYDPTYEEYFFYDPISGVSEWASVLSS